MRVGVRAKLVGLLIAVALVPLVAALLTIGMLGRRFARESFGRMMMLTATAEAKALRASLTKEVEKLDVALQYEPSVVAALAGLDSQLTPAELARLDANWPTMPATAPPMARVLNHPLAVKLKRLQRQYPRFAEVLVTDRFGQLVAATGRTTDYFQADEDWWRRAHAGGRGRVFIPPVSYDESAGVWSIDLCIPIRQDDRVVGVAKAVVDISLWVRLGREVGRRRAAIMLARRDGTILSRKGTGPLTRKARHWTGPIAAATAAGWRTTPDGEIQGYAPIRVPRRAAGVEAVGPTWVLVAYLPESEALGDVHYLSGIALAIGLAAIAALFVLGLLLVDRSLVRRVLRLGRATREVTAGDFQHRIRPGPSGRGLLGPDEIDELAEDFNRMVRRIQTTHDELREADELKMNFIRIASHELRTPVSYILGMVRLCENTEDPERLRKAIRTIGDRAERLSEIIQAMFKVLPKQRYVEDVRYGDVDVGELLEQVCRDCRPFVERRRQRLVVEAPQGMGTIQADWDKLRDIVESLVMNAIKFTPDSGRITILVGTELGGHLSIAVCDEGPGIPADEMPHIFEPFYSGDGLKRPAAAAAYGGGGVGLGLAVVRHFTELHGGEVKVESTPRGCTFTVLIPGEPPPRETRPDEPAQPAD